MGTRTTLSVSGLLLFGTITSLFAKIAYELKAEGRDGHEKFFRKPWIMATIMFIGMSFCLPIAYIEQYRLNKAKKTEALNDPLLSLAADGPKSGGVKQKLLLCLPTIFDLAATVLMNIGLLYVTASVYQMMRGAEMLFAALFSVVFLRRTLNRFHYGGIACCVVGIAVVGLSSVLAGHGGSQVVSSEEMVTGMALIVASQAVQAAQITFEDFFMADLQISPLKIVGYEGFFGTLMMICVMLPVVQHLPGQDGNGLHEDTIESLKMIFTTKAIFFLLLVHMFALLMYNFSGMCVTGDLGAVFRTVLETMRTLFVWLVDLVLWYSTHKLGEPWSKWSFLQALGFVILVSGTVIYSRGDEKEEKEIQKYEEEQALLDGDAAGADDGTGTPRPSGYHHPSTPRPSGAMPVGSAPISMHTPRSSFKSTMNLRSSYPNRASYTARQSFGRSQGNNEL